MTQPVTLFLVAHADDFLSIETGIKWDWYCVKDYWEARVSGGFKKF